MTTTISRRNLAKNTAWAIPTITVAASAPAIAASVCTDTTRTVTLNGTATSAKNTGSVTWTNAGPDALPAGTKLTYTITTTVRGATGGYINIVPDDVDGLTQTIVSGGNTPIAGSPTTATTVISLTLTADVPSGESVTASWTENNDAPAATANVRARGIMHPDGFGGGTMTVSTTAKGPDQSGTQSVTDSQGCMITLNLTAPAFPA